MAGVSTLTQSLLDLIFPPRCVNCHTLGAQLCENCRATIAIPQVPLCAHCGRPALTLGADEKCDLCASGRGPAYLTSLRAVTVYDGAIRAAILGYNFRGMRRLAEPLGEMLAEAYKRERLAADLVTHVPLHSKRRRQRGYDQSQLLARETARRLGLPFLPDAVKRARDGASDASSGRPAQHQRRAGLRARQRRRYPSHQGPAHPADGRRDRDRQHARRDRRRPGRGAPRRDHRPRAQPPKQQRILVSGRNLS
jgi:predicted amidophosphoribosyltransferase